MTESYKLSINGRQLTVEASAGTALVDILRDELGLTGTKVFCRQGFCGACTVHLDGASAASCLVPVGLVDGAEVATIESVGSPRQVAPLQQALLDLDAVQCGMCFPGMVMSLLSAARRGELQTRSDVRHAIVGNMCRCTGYDRIVEAASQALLGEEA